MRNSKVVRDSVRAGGVRVEILDAQDFLFELIERIEDVFVLVIAGEDVLLHEGLGELLISKVETVALLQRKCSERCHQNRRDVVEDESVGEMLLRVATVTLEGGLRRLILSDESRELRHGTIKTEPADGAPDFHDELLLRLRIRAEVGMPNFPQIVGALRGGDRLLFLVAQQLLGSASDVSFALLAHRFICLPEYQRESTEFGARQYVSAVVDRVALHVAAVSAFHRVGTFALGVDGHHTR